jgi:hypothetical protein
MVGVKHQFGIVECCQDHGTRSIALPQQQRILCTLGAPTNGSLATLISQRHPEFTHR